MKQYCVPVLKNQDEMQEYVLSCDRELERAMRRVARSVAALQSLRLLGLTGPTCSGKTTAAKILTDYLESHGRRVHVISIDDFYYDKAFLQKRADDDPEIEIDYDSEDTIDISLLFEKTESLLQNKETRMPRFDFQTGLRVEGEMICPRKDDVFLFEGIQILYPRVRAILERSSYRSIYIAPKTSLLAGEQLFEPNEIRLMRRLVRDYRYRASSPSFTLYLWQSVRQNEEQNIFPYLDSCHETIDSTLPYEIGMLKPFLESILAQIPPDDEFYLSAKDILRKLSKIQVIPSDLIAENSLYKEFI